ncbi:MAG: hypothetical protein R2734_09890 [Nocardioides sp.]
MVAVVAWVRHRRRPGRRVLAPVRSRATATHPAPAWSPWRTVVWFGAVSLAATSSTRARGRSPGPT